MQMDKMVSPGLIFITAFLRLLLLLCKFEEDMGKQKKNICSDCQKYEAKGLDPGLDMGFVLMHHSRWRKM